ncbi:MAG TPA: TolC family protein [Candidatus Binatia bacterium]|jgi:cobalt-zinc-cadmium efflux system outer membrane protein|nr:TolC family protein [Candidatus Binatia bacterium]
MDRFFNGIRCRNGVWLVLSLASLLPMAAPAAANTSAGAEFPYPALQHLSLAQAQHLALQGNWDLLAAAAGVDAATAQKIVAHEFPNPTLSLSTLKINVDNQPNSTLAGNGLWDRSYDTIFAVNQLFEIGGKRRNRRLSAQAGFEAAKAQFFDAKRTLDLGVARAYLAAALADENVSVLRQSAGTLREEARLAEVRLRAGEISAADKNQIEISAERFALDARAAESAAAQARVALEVLLGVPQPKADCVLDDHLESLLASTVLPPTNSTGLWRPDVQAAEAAWRKAEADLRFQKAERIPDPTVLAQYEHQPPDTPNTVGFGVSFPLPIWNRNRGNILVAQAVREQARLAYEKVRAQAVADIATALLAYDDAARRWQSYRDTIRPKSDEVRKTKAYAYQKGSASLLDMLVAERDDNDVRLAAMQAASDTAVAMATLKAATTEIQPAEVKK